LTPAVVVIVAVPTVPVVPVATPNSTVEARTLGLSNGDVANVSRWLDVVLLELLDPGLPPSRPDVAYANPRNRKCVWYG